MWIFNQDKQFNKLSLINYFFEHSKIWKSFGMLHFPRKHTHVSQLCSNGYLLSHIYAPPVSCRLVVHCLSVKPSFFHPHRTTSTFPCSAHPLVPGVVRVALGEMWSKQALSKALGWAKSLEPSSAPLFFLGLCPHVSTPSSVLFGRSLEGVRYTDKARGKNHGHHQHLSPSRASSSCVTSFIFLFRGDDCPAFAVRRSSW
jgi:hypothetical protein